MLLLKNWIAFTFVVADTYAFGEVDSASHNVINTKKSEITAGTTSQQGITLKRKVAIARFTNETQSGVSFLVFESSRDLSIEHVL